MIYDAELLELNFEDYHAQSISEHIIPQFKEKLENFEIDGTKVPLKKTQNEQGSPIFTSALSTLISKSKNKTHFQPQTRVQAKSLAGKSSYLNRAQERNHSSESSYLDYHKDSLLINSQMEQKSIDSVQIQPKQIPTQLKKYYEQQLSSYSHIFHYN